MEPEDMSDQDSNRVSRAWDSRVR